MSKNKYLDMDGLSIYNALVKKSVTTYDDSVLKQIIANKVDKVSGKELSTNDYTSEEKEKLKNIEDEAQKNPTDYLIGGSQTVISNEDNGSNVFTFTKADGSTSNFTVKNGSKGETGSSGAQGISVTKIEQTTTSVSDGGTNTITVTLSNGMTSAFNIKNGSKGSTGAAGATGERGNPGATGTRGSLIYWGTTITGTNTAATAFSGSGISSALVNDLYLNTSTWNIYQCTVSGNASTAKWVYKGNIKGATGATGAQGRNTAANISTTQPTNQVVNDIWFVEYKRT